MKKIILTLLVTWFLVSCWTNENYIVTDTGEYTNNNTDEKTLEENILENDSEKIENNENKNSEENFSIDKEKNNIPEENLFENEETKINDEALEGEVNDLLNDFVNSLDSYE